MADKPEGPLSKLGRVLGGVVLSQGQLGHQVIGQMLMYNFTEPELAGASVVVAAGTRRRSALAQAVVGTAAPALAVQALANKQDALLTLREQAVSQREANVAQMLKKSSAAQPPAAAPGAAAQAVTAQAEDPRIAAQRAELETLRQAHDGALAQIATLQRDNQQLTAQLAALRGGTDATKGATAAAVAAAPPPAAAAPPPAVAAAPPPAAAAPPPAAAAAPPPAAAAGPTGATSSDAATSRPSPARRGRKGTDT